MTLDDYLSRFADSRRIALVGPLATDGGGQPDEPVVWVDGGVNHRTGNAGFAVGDGDSADATLKLDEYLPPDKDYSDLAFVLRRLPPRFNEVRMRGFLGGRRDHELFNFGEVHKFLSTAKSPAQVWFDHEVTAYSAGEWRFTAHGMFSLAVFAPARLTLTGACQFSLTTPTDVCALSSHGLSNRGFGEVVLNTDAPAFIFLHSSFPQEAGTQTHG